MSTIGRFYVVGVEDFRWGEVFNSLPELQRDVFFSQSYGLLNAHHIYPGHQVMCAIQEFNDSNLLYPFVMRKIREVSGYDNAPDFRDIRGLYGRSGIAIGVDAQAGKQVFWSNMIEFCLENSVVSTFGRVHPAMLDGYASDLAFSMTELGSEVIVDTSVGNNIFLANAHHAVRKNFRKATDAGLEFGELESDQDIINVYDIYLDTLERNAAPNFYQFNLKFFQDLFSLESHSVKIYTARLEGEIVAFEIVLTGGIYAHSYLGGTKSSALQLQANTFLKVRIVQRLHELGFKKFYLGGGASVGDPIFKYKKGFAPNSIVTSHIESDILDKVKYEQVKKYFVENMLPMRADRIQFYEP